MLALLGWLASVSAATIGLSHSSVRQLECFPETVDHIALYRGFLEWLSLMMSRPAFFESNVFAVVDTAPNGFKYIGHVSVDLSRSSKCAIDYQRVYTGDSARMVAEELGPDPIIDVIIESHGGSGSGFKHYLLNPGKDGVSEVQVPDFTHANMGGFYVGNLEKGRGVGAVVWDAIWDDGSHYEPHRYKFTFYRWSGLSFGKPEVVETSKKIIPNPDLAAKAAGFSFKDQTEQEVMPITFLTSLPESAK